ncbi:MAG TPA: type II toxin-antitoxin system VapC family toxin [Jiangellales bacterium]|nr:type II toxin-antitoxin system VapC family toxin [Jiangellales bacterium]
MLYLDTSALVKLVVREPESAALAGLLTKNSGPHVSSALARTELVRAVRRHGDPAAAGRALEVLAGIALMNLTAGVLDEAAVLEPRTLRTLDALHLASALRLGDDADGMVVYDARLAEAARARGLDVLAPG